MGKATKVSEGVGAGMVIIAWLLENGENQLASQLAERIETINRRLGHTIPPKSLEQLRELGSRNPPIEELEELRNEED